MLYEEIMCKSCNHVENRIAELTKVEPASINSPLKDKLHLIVVKKYTCSQCSTYGQFDVKLIEKHA